MHYKVKTYVGKTEIMSDIRGENGENKINIHDEAINNGFPREVLMLLYQLRVGEEYENSSLR